jgi:hypothetical protein
MHVFPTACLEITFNISTNSPDRKRDVFDDQVAILTDHAFHERKDDWCTAQSHIPVAALILFPG